MDSNTQNKPTSSFIFFGSSRFSIIVLEELRQLGLTPSAIVTTPDKPRGRKLVVTPNVVKTWAIDHGIRVLDPAKLDADVMSILGELSADIFIVASYGKIMPRSLIELPTHKTLNIHPSLLPRYRGASPLQTAMLEDTKNTGITIMRIDEEMDHGPIIAQRQITMSEWPIYEVFEEMMAREGAKLLAEVIPGWIAGTINEIGQDHRSATYTRKIDKSDGLIDLSADPYDNFRKIQAYHEWPQAYFVLPRDGHDLRVKITAATFSDGTLTIESVIPEGRKEMTYHDFLSGYGNQLGG